MKTEYSKLAKYARKCFEERVSISDNDFIGGNGLYYIKLPNNQAVVINRQNGDVVKFWFDDKGQIRKSRIIKGGENG